MRYFHGVWGWDGSSGRGGNGIAMFGKAEGKDLTTRTSSGAVRAGAAAAIERFLPSAPFLLVLPVLPVLLLLLVSFLVPVVPVRCGSG